MLAELMPSLLREKHLVAIMKMVSMLMLKKFSHLQCLVKTGVSQQLRDVLGPCQCPKRASRATKALIVHGKKLFVSVPT